MRNGGHPRPGPAPASGWKAPNWKGGTRPTSRNAGRVSAVAETVAGERPSPQDAVHHRRAAAARGRRARTAGATCSPARTTRVRRRRGARRSTRNGSGEQCTARRTVGLRPVSAVVAVAASVQTPRQLPAEPGNLFFTSNASAEMTLVHGTAHRRRYGTRGWEGRRRRLARTSVCQDRQVGISRWIIRTEMGLAGRNEPCPCGSGKKYKKCCGGRGGPQIALPSDTAGVSKAPSLFGAKAWLHATPLDSRTDAGRRVKSSRRRRPTPAARCDRDAAHAT